MPKLWSDTIDAHRREVRDAILDATAALVGDRGLLAVTMSNIADATGIGRATLYKYFPDIEAILLAWHERQIADHLAQLAARRDRATTAAERLESVLEGFALTAHESRSHRDTALAAVLHRNDHVAQAEEQLRALVRRLVAEAAETGHVRDDVAPEELASYCLDALAGAARLPSTEAVGRLVAVTLAGLRPAR